jgi:curli biogenesis system outer membrane secretion channel CsgG
MRATIEVLSGQLRGVSKTFESVDEITIGRNPSNTFVFPADDERAVSADHARITLKGGRAILEDVGSTNGTWVDAMRITQPHPLHGTEEVTLGKNGPRIRISVGVPKTIAEIPGTIADADFASSAAAAQFRNALRQDDVKPGPTGGVPARSAVGSATVLRMIDVALERSRASDKGKLVRQTVFVREIVRLAVKESRRELKIAVGALALVIIAAFSFLMYRIISVRSEMQGIKSELVTEYQKGLDSVSAKLGEQAKDIDRQRSMYESASIDLRRDMEKLTGAQALQDSQVRSLFKDLDESRSRFSQLVKELETAKLDKSRGPESTSAVTTAEAKKTSDLGDSIRNEQQKQEKIVQQIAATSHPDPRAAAKAIAQLVQLSTQVRAADAAAAQLGATSEKLQKEQKDLVAGKKDDSAKLAEAMKGNETAAANAVLDRLSHLEQAGAPLAAAPTPVAVAAPAVAIASTGTGNVVAGAASPTSAAIARPKLALSKPYPRASLKKRIALGKFECLVAQNPWGLSRTDLEKQMRAQMTTLLRDSGKFVLVEREDLREVIDEQRLAETGVTNNQTSAQTGQLLGVQALVIGKITQLDEQVQQSKSSFNWGAMLNSVASAASAYSGTTQFAQTANALAKDPTMGSLQTTTERRNSKFTINIDFKVLDTNTGEVLFTTQGHGVAQTNEKRTAVGTSYSQGATGLIVGNDNLADGTRQALYDATMKIMEGMDGRPWQGRIMDRNGDRVILNAGDDAGLKVGDTFQVLSRGKELIDPDSGRSRGFVQTPAGTLRISQVSPLRSEADVVDQASAFKPGDDLVYLGMTRTLAAGESGDTLPGDKAPFTWASISAPKAYTGPGVNYGEVNVDLES